MDDELRARILAAHAAGYSNGAIAQKAGVSQEVVWRVIYSALDPRSSISEPSELGKPRFDGPAAWVRQGMARSRQIEQLTEHLVALRKAYRDKVSYAITAGRLTKEEHQFINDALVGLKVRLDGLHDARDKLAFDGQKIKFQHEREDDDDLPNWANRRLAEVPMIGSDFVEQAKLSAAVNTAMVKPAEPEKTASERELDEAFARSKAMLDDWADIWKQFAGIDPTAAHADTVHGEKPAERPERRTGQIQRYRPTGLQAVMILLYLAEATVQFAVGSSIAGTMWLMTALVWCATIVRSRHKHD